MNPSEPIALETVKATMNAYHAMVYRAEHIARLLGYKCDNVTFGGGYLLDDPSAVVYCYIFQKYSSAELLAASFPLRYLWMTDAEIVAIASKEKV